MGFCVCNPQDKKNRVASDKMCCVHRRFVCEDCVSDANQKPSHLTCTIKNYSDWVRDAYHEHPVKCSLSGEEITDAKPFVRLTCFCLFFADPLRKHLSELDVPRDEIKCPRCDALIYSKLHHKRSTLRTKLAELLDTVTLKQPLPKTAIPSTSTSIDQSDHEKKATDESSQGSASTPAVASSSSSAGVHYAELQSRRKATATVESSSSSHGDAQGDKSASSTSTMRHKSSVRNSGDDSVIDIGDDGVLSDADHQPKPRRLPPRPIRAWIRGGSNVSIRTVVLTIMICAIVGLFSSPFLIQMWSASRNAAESVDAADIVPDADAELAGDVAAGG